MTIFGNYKVKTQYIKIDILVKDIYRKWSDVPSSYTVPKRKLSEARSYTHNDLKRAIKELTKAEKLFREESVVATEYNRIAPIMDDIDDSAVKSKRLEYLSAVNDGDYNEASKIVKELSSLPEVVNPRPGLKLSVQDTGDDYVLLTAENGLRYNITIVDMNFVSNVELRTDIIGTLLLKGSETATIRIDADVPIEYPFDVKAIYSDRGFNRIAKCCVTRRV